MKRVKWVENEFPEMNYEPEKVPMVSSVEIS